jgi:ribosomal protein S18 acetylase RimI-like enzyme
MKCKLLTDGLIKTYGYFDGEVKIASCILREKIRGEFKGSYSLEKVFIEEEYRGRGLCRKFLECIFKKKEYSGKTIFLDVLQNNEPAIKCYTNLGFKEIDKGRSTLYMRKN